MIAVAQDVEGLRTAARELLEDSYQAPLRQRNARLAEQSADPDAVLAAADSERTLSPGYYIWLGFVAEEIERPLEAGMSFSGGELLAEELVALNVLKEARAEFRRKHPPCRNCGKLLPHEWDKQCNECQREEAERIANARRGR